jgi:uncharacterized protein (DUF302 family)
MIIESKSPFSFTETAEKLQQAIEAREWKMPALHDLQQTMRNFGEEVLPVKVFEICKPQYSKRILELDAERIVSVMMPCRISVYERKDGSTYISRLNPAAMGASFSGIIGEVMLEAANEVEEIIGAVIK